jgi:hypothetical protein
VNERNCTRRALSTVPTRSGHPTVGRGASKPANLQTRQAVRSTFSLLVDVLHANGRHGGKGVAYDVGHLGAALGAHNCATAHRAADDVATDYPRAVSATNAFVDKARPS